MQSFGASILASPLLAEEPAWVRRAAHSASLRVQREVWGSASAADAGAPLYVARDFGSRSSDYVFQNLCHAVLRSGEWRAHGERGAVFVPKPGEEDAARLRACAEWVELRPSRIEGAGSGVFARRALPAGFVLPYVGAVYRAGPDVDSAAACAYRLSLVDDPNSWVLDGHPDLLRALRVDAPVFATRVNETPAGHAEANCKLTNYETPEWAHLTPGAVVTTRDVEAGEELFADYGEDYQEIRDELYPDTVVVRE